MIIDVQFESTDTEFDCDFGEVTNISDGGYERGLVEGEKVGYEKGSAEGYTKGEADGRNAEWSALWDGIQINGNRKDYRVTFAGAGWTKENFKPKYDISPTNAESIFNSAFYNEPEPVDLTEMLESAGVTLDFSRTTAAATAFASAKIKRVPVMNLTSFSNIPAVFRLCYALETIDGLILKDDGTQNFSLTFGSCDHLKEIGFIQGVIGKSISFKESPLNKQTIIRVINALSEESTGQSVTITKGRVNKEFETEEGKLDGTTTTEWLDLIATKPNWTISLT